MLRLSIVQDEIAKFQASRMDFSPQTTAEVEAFEQALHEACEDMAEADFRAACRLYRKTHEKWPSVAGIVKLSPAVARAKLAEVAEADYWPALVQAIGSGGAGSDEDRQVKYFFSAVSSAGLPTPSDSQLDRIEAALKTAGGWDAVATETDAYRKSEMGRRFRDAMKGTVQPSNVVHLADQRAKNAALPFGHPRRLPTGGA